MAQTIQIKRNNSNATTKPSSLLVGELAGNLLDRSLFSSDGSSVFQFYTGTNKWFDTSGNANNANKLGGVAASSYLTSHQDISHLLSKDAASKTYQTIISTSNKIPFDYISGKPTTLAGYGITDALSASGGTITSTNIAPLSIKRNGTGGAFISFENNNGRKGYIGITNSSQLYFYVGDQIETPSRILHEGNYSSYALPLSGGSIKGSSSATLYVDTSHETQNNIFIQCKSAEKTYIGWSSSNGSYICNYASGGRLGIKDDGTPYFGTNTLVHSGNYTNFSPTRYTNAGANNMPIGAAIGYTYTTEDHGGKYTGGVINFGTDNYYAQLNGAINEYKLAYRYKYGTAGFSEWKDIAFTDSNITGNAASATKLQTARTIWGQSFDGTGNISGDVILSEKTRINTTHLVFQEPDAGGWARGVRFTNTEGTVIGEIGGSGTVTNGLGYCYIAAGAWNSQKALRVYANGNVNIGFEGSPSYKLAVNGTAYVADSLSTGKAIIVGTGIYLNNNQYLFCRDSNNEPISTFYINNGNLLAIGYGTIAKGYSTAIYGGGGVNLRYGTSGSNGLTINSEGYTKVFNSFEVVGNAYLSADVTITGQVKASGDGVFGSDARYKSKLQDLAVDLTTIANAPVFSYKWTDREDDKVHLGTTAQYWLETNFKDAVDTSNKDFYHLNYGALGVAIGVTVAKEQIIIKNEQIIIKSEVEVLRERVKELENQVKQLRQWHN